VNMNTYIPHQIKDIAHSERIENSNELRKHHFIFGNPDQGNTLLTMSKQDYRQPVLDDHKNHKIDPSQLRVSHFDLGDKSQNPLEPYGTTYNLTMKPQYNHRYEKKGNNSFKSSVNISGNEKPGHFATESGSNYGFKVNEISHKEIKEIKTIINNIKGHHFHLGENNNDYKTTSENTFKYDPSKASNAKTNLDQRLKDDLRATHYKLGYMENPQQTTHNSTYVPLEKVKETYSDPHLRRAHVDIHAANNKNFNSKTIYMTDFDKKNSTII